MRIQSKTCHQWNAIEDMVKLFCLLSKMSTYKKTTWCNLKICRLLFLVMKYFFLQIRKLRNIYKLCEGSCHNVRSTLKVQMDGQYDYYTTSCIFMRDPNYREMKVKCKSYESNNFFPLCRPLKIPKHLIFCFLKCIACKKLLLH